MTTFTIPGKPFAKQRSRFNGKTAYTPKETVSFERTVGVIASQHFPEPIEGPVKLMVLATFEPPKSWSKKKTAEKINRPHTQKPDLDNIVKALKDGLNRIAFADDSQVAQVSASKVWGPHAQTVVFVEPINRVEVSG